jgi:DNA-binding NarL/FixJ family response regulator
LGDQTLVAVVHGSPPLRDGLGELLGRQSDLRVLRLYGSAGEMLEHLPEGEHVLLYDLATAHKDGPAKVMKVRESLPGAKILMFNVTDDDQAIIECVRIGASGCVLQDASLEELVDAVRSLAQGKPSASPRVLTSLFSYVASLRDEDHPPLVPKLTEREEQILQLMAEGLSNQEIARRLFLQPQTVKNYVHLLFQKLDVHSRLEVIRSLRSGRR